MSSEEHDQGWYCADLQLGMMVYELFLTTTGDIYCLSNKAKWAQRRRESAGSTGKGLLVDLVQDATIAAIDASTDFSSDSGTLKERLASNQRNFVVKGGEILEFFAGETGLGFGKRRAGIYFRPEYRRKLPGTGAPGGLSLFIRLYEDPGMTGIMSGWCEALKIPFVGFDETPPTDPVWLSGPQAGETSQSAAEAFAWMAENVGALMEPPPLRNVSGGGAGSAEKANNMARFAPVFGGIGLATVFASWCGALFMPMFATMFSCLILPLAVLSIVFGIAGFLNANKRLDGAGKVPALVGVGLGVLMIFMACAGKFVLPMVQMAFYSASL